MATFFNGAEVADQIFFNGSPQSAVYLNGTLLWEDKVTVLPSMITTTGTISSGGFNSSLLIDGNTHQNSTPAAVSAYWPGTPSGWFQFDFGREVEVDSLTMWCDSNRCFASVNFRLEYFDGASWHSASNHAWIGTDGECSYLAQNGTVTSTIHNKYRFWRCNIIAGSISGNRFETTEVRINGPKIQYS